MIMPMPYYPTSAGVGAQITMGAGRNFISAQAASDLGITATGSATGNLSADGGTIEVLGQQSSVKVQFIILGGNGTNPLTVKIDGTNYTANYQSAYNGYQFYNFNGSIFTTGNTYTVIVT